MNSNAGFTYINNIKDLRDASKVWETCSELGVDLECENNLHHYGSYISLIQISNSTKHWIVDVLSLDNKNPLIRLFKNENVQKIFHDVSFDIRIIYEEFGCRTVNIFDTQIAAILIGKKDLGLGSLLKEYFDIKKEDKFQMADWTKRPLKENMLAYATKDSRYLIRLKKILKDELNALGRLEWAEEEFELLEDIDLHMRKFEFSDIKGASLMSDKERAILKRLFDLREKMAKKANRPIHFIMNNKLLKQLAANPPRSIGAWINLKGVHPIVHRFAKEFHEAVEKGKNEKSPYEFTKKWYYTQKQKDMLNELNEIRESVTKKLGIEKHVLMNKEQMKEIVLNNNLDSLKKWQRQFVDIKFE